MKSHVAHNMSGHKLTLAAAVLLNAGSAFAATIADDAQAQAQTLLSGLPADRTDTAHSSLPATATFESAVEPQEQARRLLAGKLTLPNPVRQSATSMSAYVEAQEAARRMILGKGI